MAANDYANLVAFHEALSRLLAFKDANTEALNFATVESLIDTFHAAIMAEVHN